MALNLKAKGIQSTSVSRVSEGNDVYVRAMRDGTLFSADWKQGLILEGKGFIVNVGALSTPIVGGGNGTVIDLDQPEFVISIPSGTSIMPLKVVVTCTVPLLATDADECEILLAVDQDAAYARDGSYTSETIYCLNTLKGSSTCTAISAASADITDPVLDIELDHVQITGDVQGTAATALWTPLKMDYSPANPPVINGPAMLVGYWGGTVATYGFASISWLELATTSVAL